MFADAAVAGGGAPAPGNRVDVDDGLRRLGHRTFRPGQREAIETLFEARRLLLVAPTGGGKSLTYQLPAALLPGTTIVISPLIALMHDQVTALQDKGVPATYLAATLPHDEVRRRVRALSAGAFKLVYIAPERLASDWLRAALARLACPLVAIDEAHCISAWGHDFRPDYLHLDELVRLLPEARVLACTATATPVVRDEILERLGLPAGTPQLIHGFARPNLALRAAEVLSKRERDQHVDGVLVETLNGPEAGAGTAIVYAPTRRGSEEEGRRGSGAHSEEQQDCHKRDLEQEGNVDQDPEGCGYRYAPDVITQVGRDDVGANPLNCQAAGKSGRHHDRGGVVFVG